jgi:hypothetical protein
MTRPDRVVDFSRFRSRRRLFARFLARARITAAAFGRDLASINEALRRGDTPRQLDLRPSGESHLHFHGRTDVGLIAGSATGVAMVLGSNLCSAD